MKKILFILLLTIPFVGFGQSEVKIEYNKNSFISHWKNSDWDFYFNQDSTGWSRPTNSQNPYYYENGRPFYWYIENDIMFLEYLTTPCPSYEFTYKFLDTDTLILSIIKDPLIKKPISVDELTNKGTEQYPIFYYELEPYDGIVFDTHENGQLRVEGIVHNGKRDGVWRYYYNNGPETLYWEDGTLWKEGNYKYGKEDGLWKYYRLGKLDETRNYNHGLQTNWKYYYKNGQIYEEGDYKNGKKEGLYKSYYENGQLKLQWEYKNDKLIDNTKRCWDKDGKEIDCED